MDKKSVASGNWGEVTPIVGNKLESIIGKLLAIQNELGDFKDLVDQEYDRLEKQREALTRKLVTEYERRHGVKFETRKTVPYDFVGSLGNDGQDMLYESDEWIDIEHKFRWIEEFSTNIDKDKFYGSNHLQRILSKAIDVIRSHIHDSNRYVNHGHQRRGSLRNRLIRLAHANPELRKDILPLLK